MAQRQRRKPFVLSSTVVLESHFPVSRNPQDVSLLPPLQFKVGILEGVDILLAEKNCPRMASSLDASALVGLSMSALKRLAITSDSPDSLVLVKNIYNDIQRIGQVLILDHSDFDQKSADNEAPFSRRNQRTLLFPSYCYSQKCPAELDQETVYLSPLLIFNLSLHVSSLKSFVGHGKESLSSLFEAQLDNKTSEKENASSSIRLELKPLTQSPKYATHVRIAFVRIPECNTLVFFKKSPSIEEGDHQELIDQELKNYFSIDRFLSEDDIFSISIKWDCKSPLCASCNKKMESGSKDIIYFKVVSIEPLEEPILRVNRTKTALVLGGSSSSAIPPDILIPGPKFFLPLQQNTVKTLVSILAPPLCPSVLSSKYRVSVLLHGLHGCGKRTVVKYVARQLGLHLVEYNCHSLMASSERKASSVLAQAFTIARRYSPTILLLRHFDVFSDLASKEGLSHEQQGVNSEIATVIKKFTQPLIENGTAYDDHSQRSTHEVCRHPLLFIAAADSSEGLPPNIRRCFTHEISMGPLTEEQRIQMFTQSLQPVAQVLPNTSPEDLMKGMVGQTSGFLARDIQALIADACATFVSGHLVQPDIFQDSLNSCAVNDYETVIDRTQSMGKEDFLKALEQALERTKKRIGSALGTPKVPNVKWEDVGGLEDVKKSILDTIQLPLLHKELFSSGLRRRSGVLLYGPPGTGKTLLAKAVATECSLNFISVKGPELINMYIGESEKNVRDIFQKARSARPCVIFFDELDSLAPARGVSGDSGGVMDRVVSQMLAEIDGLNDSSQDLFIIGASNRPDLIDTALLRPGRFDKLLYVGVNSETSYRERVLKALTRKFKLHDDVSLNSVAERCPLNFTGADMYALCADAWFHAAKRQALAAGSDSTSSSDQPDSVVVEYNDFIKVLGELSPSLSMEELKKYESLRDRYEGASR